MDPILQTTIERRQGGTCESTNSWVSRRRTEDTALVEAGWPLVPERIHEPVSSLGESKSIPAASSLDTLHLKGSAARSTLLNVSRNSVSCGN